MGAKRVRLWCIPAAESRDILVMARLTAEGRRWTHLLRWRPGRAPEPGAWANLKLIHAKCRVDPGGTYLRYLARGGTGPFRGSDGGGIAISRAPWLSALTDIKPWGMVGGGTSEHALSSAEQQRLWSMFKPDYVAKPWFLVQQPDWEKYRREIRGVRRGSGDLVAVQRAEGLAQALVVHWPGATGTTVSRLRPPRFYLLDEGSGATALERLRGVVWARLDPGGSLLVATDDGRLRIYHRHRRSGPTASPAGWTLRDERDLSGLTPNPGPSPKWARAALARPSRL